MFFLAVILIICGVSNAAVFTVGDSRGWTTVGHINYKTWAASKEFHVGDTILFEYPKEFHNVVRVTHENFNTCNGTSPYQVWNSGNDSFTIQNSGHYFFISTLLENQCEEGQKVDIRVPKTPPPKASPPQSPATSPSGNVAPLPPPSSSAPAPAPAPPLPPPSSPAPESAKSDATRSWSKLELVFVAFSLSLFRF
ncbi:hypothetical protein Leryth_010295 [Lithospermum erythrorhizon]|nr:hypothetical protein Leryth_010295 [Lithospermum erythrorhizon]